MALPRINQALAVAALPILLVAGAFTAPQAAAQTPPDWGPLELLGRSIAPGQKRRFSYVGASTFEGAFLDTAVFVARGARAGPTLCLTAMLHGDERNGFEIARTAFAQTEAPALAGTLIALPAVNINGFRTGSRYMPDRRDLNRAFPGDPNGSNTALIASIVFQTLSAQCSALIDLHTGSFERANLPQTRVDLGRPEAVEIAQRFGAPLVLGGAGPRGSLRREMMEVGIPAIIYEAGLPLRFERTEIEHGVQGVRNVMMHLGMISGRPSAATPTARVFSRTRWLRVPIDGGGVFYPEKKLGDTVRAGEVVAYIDDPFTDARSFLRAPADGLIIGMAVPQVVLSGYALLRIARN